MKKSELQQRIENAEKELAEAKALLAKEKTKPRVVDSVRDIPNRDWYFLGEGSVEYNPNNDDLDQMSTKERAEAILALIQLIEIHAAIEQEFDTPIRSIQLSSPCKNRYIDFYFESEELAREFKSKHKDLMETVRKGL